MGNISLKEAKKEMRQLIDGVLKTLHAKGQLSDEEKLLLRRMNRISAIANWIGF